jgi:hypothetical protein
MTLSFQKYCARLQAIQKTSNWDDQPYTYI